MKQSFSFHKNKICLIDFLDPWTTLKKHKECTDNMKWRGENELKVYFEVLCNIIYTMNARDA